MPNRTSRHPLHFHEIHGKNIELKCDRRRACRKSDSEESCLNNDNIIFTDRPVNIHEPIAFKITKTTDFRSQLGLRLGFTVHDPYNSQGNMKHIINHSWHLTHSLCRGNWARLLTGSVENRQMSVVSFYVDQDGAAYYAIDDVESYLTEYIDISRKLWAFIDLSGCTSEIELFGLDSSSLDIEKSTLVNAESQKISFHRIHGQDVRLSKDKSIAWRSRDPGDYAYIFTNRPFEIESSQKVFFSVNKLQKNSEGVLEYGVTSTDPSKIAPVELPENTGDLLNFPNYWVIVKDKNNYNSEDFLLFLVTREGKFMVLRNFASWSCIFQVDIKQPLWLFIKLSGSVSEISLQDYSTEEYGDTMIMEQNKLIVPPKSNLCSYGSTALVDPKENTECILCLGKPKDCVIYSCGHICMCYECAKSAWKCKKIVTCPVCSGHIQDVIKMYN